MHEIKGFRSLLLVLFHFITISQSLAKKIEYPAVKREVDTVDDYFGTVISDPYRWLEDSKSEDTKKFVKDQNELLDKYLENYPQKEEIREGLTKLWDFPQTDCPRKAANRYFFFQNTGLQNQSIMYVKESLDGKPRIILDPNVLAEDGTISVDHSTIAPSIDGQILAYGLSQQGADWLTLKFKNVTTGEDFPESLVDVKFSEVLWTPNNHGIIYGRYPRQELEDGTETNVAENQKLFFHKIGTDQSNDVLVAEFPENSKWIVGLHNRFTANGRYLIIVPLEGVGTNYLFYTDVEAALKTDFQGAKLDIKPLFTTENATYQYLASDDSVVYFVTNKNAKNNQIVSIDLEKVTQSNRLPEDTDWTINVPEGEHVLDFAFVAKNNKLVLSYLEDVKNTIELRNLKNGSLISKFPIEAGSIHEHVGKFDNAEFFYSFKSFLTPEKIFRVDLDEEDPQPKLYFDAKVNGFDASEYETKQIFYKSKDDTKIPMYIVHKKDFVPNGDSPCLLTGYGGFAVSISPEFKEHFVYFLQHFNGIIAVPNIRGGGEYGQKWHDAGRLHNKQNTFDDFAAAAEYLINEKYTEPSKIIIEGQSNGGLLVAASINQRPELFGAAIARVPLTDMLRFQLFTTTYFACVEYGCSNNKEQFETLIKYSPLHTVKLPSNETIQFPATLVITGEKDDRLVPSHSYKYIAELQNSIGNDNRQTNPLMLRVEQKVGHGAGKSTAKQIEEWTEIFSFIAQSLGLKLNKN